MRGALSSSPPAVRLHFVAEPSQADAIDTPIASGIVEVSPASGPPVALVEYLERRGPGSPILALAPARRAARRKPPAAFLPVVTIPISEPGAEFLRRSAEWAVERAELVERLRAAEVEGGLHQERFRLLTQSTRVALWDWDLRHGRLWRSEGFGMLFGYGGEEISDDLGWWIARIHPEDRERVLERAEAPLTGEGEGVRQQYRLRRRDGSYATVLDTGMVILGSHDRPVRMIGTLRETSVATDGEEGCGVAPVARSSGQASPKSALERLSAIEHVTDASLALLSLEDLLRELLLRLRATLGADAAMAHLVAEDGTILVRRAWLGLGSEAPRPVQIPFGAGITGTIAATGTPQIVESLRESELLSPVLRDQFASLLGVPLTVEGKTIGVLSVMTRDRRAFTANDQSLIQLVADRIAPTIDRANLIERARVEHQRLEALAHRLVRLQEEERREIARNLHDEAGQLLTALRLSLEGKRLDRTRCWNLLHELSDQLRSISMNLHPPMLDDLGLLPALRWHVERFISQTGIATTLRHEALDGRFRPQAELAAFRIVQEALTNVAKHARAREARVSVVRRDRRLHVAVADSGVGFDPEASPRASTSGLMGMRERVHLLGGRLAIRSSPGTGTEVAAELPSD